jgi:3-oxoacyl-[acyl-carrier protein] reductase
MENLCNLEGKFAIVTGSSKGIGKETAILFAKRGATVLVCGRRPDATEETAANIRDLGGKAFSFHGDLSKPDAAKSMVRAALEHSDQIDILVNNAGIVRMEPFLEFQDSTWLEHIDIHMSGAFYCSRAVAREMSKTGGGSIVNLSTIAARMGNFGFAAYGPVKAALESLTRVLAVELATSGISVNVVAPGPVLNDQLLSLYGEERLRERGKTIPMGRLAHTEEVTRAILFFASPENRYITGQVLGVDGGASAAGCFTMEVYRRQSEQS